MKNLKSLAVIGSRGMVGSDLTRYLKSYFEKVTSIDRKNYDRHKGKRFDIVINANGNSNKVWAKNNVFSDFAASTTSVYASLFDFPCKTYIYISSADVYPNHANKKFTYESKTIEVENLSSYGFHKYLSECIVKNFIKNYIILRCPMILGTNLKKGPIYDILHNSRLFVASESAFQMITTYELTQIINFLLAQNITKEVFNVGGRSTVILRKITEYVRNSATFPKDGEIVRYEINVSKLDKIYHLKTSGEYLQDLVKNYKKYYNSKLQ